MSAPAGRSFLRRILDSGFGALRQLAARPSPPAEPEPEPELEIVPDHLRAAGVIYSAWALEEMRVFQVVDRIVELFAGGSLPIGNGGERLEWWRRTGERSSQAERRLLYARVLGVPGGDQPGEPNLEFPELFLRFCASLRACRGGTDADSAEALRTAGLALARNLSPRAVGAASALALRVDREIREAVAILSDPEVQTAIGARDLWQVVQQVAQRDLGGSVNIARYHALAQSGPAILRWLADRSVLLVAEGAVLFDPAADAALVTAAEQVVVAANPAGE